MLRLLSLVSSDFLALGPLGAGWLLEADFCHLNEVTAHSPYWPSFFFHLSFRLQWGDRSYRPSFSLGPRGPLIEPSISVPSVHPSYNKFSWVHRWAETLPSGLRDPLKSYIFWKPLMSAIQIRIIQIQGQIQRQIQRQIQIQIQRQIQRQRQIKGKPDTPMMWYISERRWQKDSEYDMQQAAAGKKRQTQRQTQTQIQRQIQEHPTAWCYMFLERRWQ